MANPESASVRSPSSKLRRVRQLRELTIGATDGDLGRVEDLYFDDQSWTVRYVVVATGAWLLGRSVLISPRAIRGVDVVGQRLVTNLTRQQVKDSPDIDTRRPVSRQHEVGLYDYYAYPYYWTGPYRWGAWADPYAIPDPTGASYPPAPPSGPTGAEELAARDHTNEDPHLRSARDVSGHAIDATDGRLGHVEDFLVDDTEWAIRYLVVDPKNWWPGAHVAISVEWITRVSWSESAVHVSVDRDAVRGAPTYDDAGELDREQEIRLHAHYGRPAYWERRPELWMYPPAA